MKYCIYCGRVAHRCRCDEPESAVRRLLARQPAAPDYTANLRDKPYKRGVPPQIKQRERAVMRRHYAEWYAELATTYGEACLNCGADDALVIDHVVPVAKGGHSVLDNLQLLCATCNGVKGKLAFDCRPRASGREPAE